jgi:hypothetical protein
MPPPCCSMSGVKLLFTVLGAAAALVWVSTAHADPPSRTFVGDFIGNDATVENYLSVGGSCDRAQNSESVYLEKTVSSNSSFSIFAGYQRFEQEEESTTSSNLELAYKHILLELPRHEFVLTISPSLELPLGNNSGGSETHARAGVDVLFQKGLADLPDSLALLRPAGVEGDWGWQSKVTGARDDLMSGDLELEYSLEYLDENVAANSVPRAMRQLTPNLAFDYGQYLSAHRNSSQPNFELTPAIAWLYSSYEVNLGVQVAVNRAAAGTGGGAVAFVWMLGVSFDEIVPALGWQPFR